MLLFKCLFILYIFKLKRLITSDFIRELFDKLFMFLKEDEVYTIEESINFLFLVLRCKDLIDKNR
jgi:hypothetical protein